jgi:hypothetical protein
MGIAQETLNPPKAKADLLFGEFLVSKGLLSHRELIEALNDAQG